MVLISAIEKEPLFSFNSRTPPTFTKEGEKGALEIDGWKKRVFESGEKMG